MKTFDEAIALITPSEKLFADLMDQNDHNENAEWVERMEDLAEVYKELEQEGVDNALEQVLCLAFAFGQRVGMEMEKE